MMETTGTTAYDGSGNGNHGTISGATYVNGVGAAVAQTSVIDWNKGVNEAVYSEEFDNAAWDKLSTSVSANSATAPDGQTTADTITFTALESSARVQDFYAGSFGNLNQIVSVWARVTSGTKPFRFKCSHGGVADYFSNDLTATTEWQRFSFSQTFGAGTGTGVFYGLYNGTDLAARSLEFWGFQLQTNAATLTPYVRTGATTQPTPVLLPAGLTTGRDITGVNLFENGRKQGALNLDGQSWAEVHDNASLDMTQAITAECWVYWRQTSGSVDSGILARYYATESQFLFYHQNDTSIGFYINSTGTLYNSMTEGWHHIIGTYDKANRKLYVNGVLVATDAMTADLNSVSKPLEIGTYFGSSNYTTDDTIAQPRIYNRALTASEVLRNYNSGKNTYTNS
jgi:hypothetical protein